MHTSYAGLVKTSEVRRRYRGGGYSKPSACIQSTASDVEGGRGPIRGIRAFPLTPMLGQYGVCMGVMEQQVVRSSSSRFASVTQRGRHLPKAPLRAY